MDPPPFTLLSNKGQSEIIKKNIYLTFQWLCWILYLYKQFLRLGQNIPLSYSLLLSHNVVSSTPLWTGFALTTLVVIGTDCTGSCKFYYHTITITTAPINCQWHYLLIICFKWWRCIVNVSSLYVLFVKDNCSLFSACSRGCRHVGRI